MIGTLEYIHSNLTFQHLPAFADYVKNKQLDQYVQLQLEFSRELNLPILEYFKWMSEEELIELSKIENIGSLTYLVENNAKGMIEVSIERWIQNQLPGIAKTNFNSIDLSIIIYIRKKAFLKLISGYTDDLNTAIKLIEEIDILSLEQQSISVKTYIDIINQEIKEHLHFTQKITETTPGLIYVYDLFDQKEIYINNKVSEVLGYSTEEVSEMENGILSTAIHPDDREYALQFLKDFPDQNSPNVHSFKYRLKDKVGEYKWMHNYFTVFKKTPDGTPWHIIGIALNIDKEKKAEEELQYREEQLLEAQEMTHSGSFLWNFKKGNATTTPELHKIININDEDFFDSLLLSIHRKDKDRVQSLVLNAIESRSGFNCEFTCFTEGFEKSVRLKGKVRLSDDKDVIVKGTIMDITSSQKLLRQLKESEKLYKQAEALTHIGNWKWNIKENLVEWSDELFRIHSLEPQSETITFEKVVSFIHPDQKQLVVDKVTACLKEKTPYEVYYKLLLPDQTIKYLYGKGELLKDANGELEFLFGTAQDITEQYITQSLLEENQKYLEKLTDAAPSLMVAYNVQSHQYTFVSKAVEFVLGYKQKEVLQEGLSLFRSIIHPDDVRSVFEKNNNAITLANEGGSVDKQDIITEFTYRIKHKNGSYRWLQTYAAILDRDKHDKVEHMLHISMDITDKVEAEQKIMEQEHLIKHIADASPTILYVYDLVESRVVYTNKEIYNTLGFTQGEIIELKDRFFDTVFHPDDFEAVALQHQELINNNSDKTVIEYEVRMKNKTEDWKYVLLKEIVFKRDDKTGEVVQVLCAALDISQRKEMERTLFEKTIELHQSNKSLEEFAYVASHDLKEPLRKIAAFGDRLILHQEDNLDTNGKFFLSKIIDSSKRMNTMIDDLLALSMITNTKEFELYNLQSILEEVKQTLEFKIEKSNASISADQLPTLRIIPSQFRQLFQNLLSNAVKFTADDKRPEIRIASKILKDISAPGLAKAQKYLQLQFIDNGIGFEQEYAEKIFVVFQRLHGRSEYDGTGIGLAICKKIVENHGGIIRATSIPGQGSTFTVVIPANKL